MWLLALAALPFVLIPILAMVFVDYAFGKWGGVDNNANLTGTQVAERIKQTAALTPVVETSSAGDHYDPHGHKVRLTEKIADQPSVLALAVTAHELGHAQQHQDDSNLIQMRNFLLPAIQISPSVSYALVSIGVGLRFFKLVWIGAGLFVLVVVFMFLTLPIEVDASRRGIKLLEDSGLLTDKQDRRGARQVLTAAALTYVSASALSIGQLLRYIRLARLG